MKKIYLYIIFTLTLCVSTKAQTIYVHTFAGNGIPGYSGDGGPAIAASLNAPSGMAIDKAGNIYFSDYNNNVIRKISTDSIITTYAGDGTAGYSGDGGPATMAKLSGPVKLALDSKGNLYFADYFNNVIRKIDTSGIITTVVGTGYPGYSGDGGPDSLARLWHPTGIAIDKNDDIYISDYYNSVIRKVTPGHIITTIAGNGYGGYSGDHGPATAAELYQAHAITIDDSGNLYIADAGNNVIRKVDTSGIITTIIGNGTAGYSGDGGPATSAELYNVSSICIDKQGNMYLGDEFNYVVREVDTSGTISTIAGNGTHGYSGDGGPAISAQFALTEDVHLSPKEDKLYICDNKNNRIRVLSLGQSNPNNVSEINTIKNARLFPNPAHDIVSVKADHKIFSVKIYDLLGKEFIALAPASKNVSINVQALPPGFYLININNQYMQKLIKE